MEDEEKRRKARVVVGRRIESSDHQSVQTRQVSGSECPEVKTRSAVEMANRGRTPCAD
jgi:hypothetical protein